jgi:hypothetical protein
MAGKIIKPFSPELEDLKGGLGIGIYETGKPEVLRYEEVAVGNPGRDRG